MSTELFACKAGMDRTNVTAVVEPLSLYRELLLQPKNSRVLLRTIRKPKTQLEVVGKLSRGVWLGTSQRNLNGSV